MERSCSFPHGRRPPRVGQHVLLILVSMASQCGAFRPSIAFTALPILPEIVRQGACTALRMSSSHPQNAQTASIAAELTAAKQELARHQAAAREQEERIRVLAEELRKQQGKDSAALGEQAQTEEATDLSQPTPGPLPSLTAVGTIKTCFPTKNGCPRQGAICPSSAGQLRISFGNNPQHSLDGLADFSHVWLLFLFHDNGANFSPRAKVFPPRLGGKPKGVFSTRAPHRPNAIGLTLCRLDRVHADTLFLSGVDLIDGTPILDVKPYIPAYDYPQYQPETIRCPAWALPSNSSSLSVSLSPHAQDQLLALQNSPQRPSLLSTWEEAVEGLQAVLAADPRSVYRKTKCAGHKYPLYYDRLNVWSEFDDAAQHVTIVDLALRDNVTEGAVPT
mmetsp:Transcript_35666/g.83878  ORF Transcript_35666/g.83878 Transcript_35666/m.83878 type:complete len:391 (-) Transcript_35666:458-1630(-)